jgi:hypothetical protein
VVLGLAACTSRAGEDDQPNSVGGQSASPSLDADGKPYSGVAVTSPVELPFEAYFVAAEAAVATLDAEWWGEAHQAVVSTEEYVAACMKRAGFTYYPQIEEEFEERDFYEGQGINLAIPQLPDALADVQRIGYGVSSPDEMYPQDVEVEPLESQAKNEAYFDGLSNQAKKQYRLAQSGFDEYIEGETVDDPDACQPKAYVLYPVPDYPDASFLGPMDVLQGVISKGFQTVEGDFLEVVTPGSVYADERLAALDAEYGACVKANHNGGLWNPDVVTDPLSMMQTALGTAADGSLVDPSYAGKPIDIADVPLANRALIGSQLEIDMAVVDYKCRAETDYVNRFADILVDVETRYIERHQAELDRMMAAIEEVLARE